MGLAAGSRLAACQGMKGIFGISAAVVIIVLQVAGYAAWHVEPATRIAPVDGPELVHGRA